jgi:hypothetical protein
MLVGDPMLRRDVVFVADESKRLGRPLTPGEYPSRIPDAFMFPSSMSLERKNGMLRRLVIEAGKTDSWESNFALLEMYWKREGHCNVPRLHKEDGASLGGWVAYQRKAKKKEMLRADQAHRLESIGFVWDMFEAQWENMFALLETYKKREGHCNVPISHKEDGAHLGIWVQTQRTSKKKEMLSADKVRQLESIGLEWEFRASHWKDMFALLETYKKREGQCDVPISHKEDGVSLGFWVSNQRASKRKGGLSVDKVRQLESIGLGWEPLASQWEDMFALLQTYVKREGHCNVPVSHKEDGASLGAWVQRQRRSKKKGGISVDKVRQLERIGFVWGLR